MSNSSRNSDEAPRDERAERRDRRKRSERDRMQKHGASTGSLYRNVVMKRLREIAGRKRRGRKR